MLGARRKNVRRFGRCESHRQRRRPSNNRIMLKGERLAIQARRDVKRYNAARECIHLVNHLAQKVANWKTDSCPQEGIHHNTGMEWSKELGQLFVRELSL